MVVPVTVVVMTWRHPTREGGSMGKHRSGATLRRFLFGGRQVRRHVVTRPLVTIELVDRRTEIAHLVADEVFADGRRDGGCYRAVCGLVVLPASLTAPGHNHCPACERGNAPTRRRGVVRGDR